MVTILLPLTKWFLVKFNSMFNNPDINEISNYIFMFVNAFQGIFIFLLFGCSKNKNKILKEKVSEIVNEQNTTREPNTSENITHKEIQRGIKEIEK